MFDLVAGSRRCRAAATIGWKEIKADVQPPTDKATRIVQNVVENLQRKDLSLYEQARACAELRTQGLKVKDIAAQTGMSEQDVSNLAAMFKGLPKLVLNDWEAGHEAATFNYLRELTTAAKEAKSPEEGAEIVLERWKTRTELYKDFNEALVTEDEPEEPEE